MTGDRMWGEVRDLVPAQAVVYVEGKVVLEDGSESQFSINREGWEQWGASTERLIQSVTVVGAMAEALTDMWDE